MFGRTAIALSCTALAGASVVALAPEASAHTAPRFTIQHLAAQVSGDVITGTLTANRGTPVSGTTVALQIAVDPTTGTAGWKTTALPTATTDSSGHVTFTIDPTNPATPGDGYRLVTVPSNSARPTSSAPVEVIETGTPLNNVTITGPSSAVTAKPGQKAAVAATVTFASGQVNAAHGPAAILERKVRSRWMHVGQPTAVTFNGTGTSAVSLTVPRIAQSGTYEVALVDPQGLWYPRPATSASFPLTVIRPDVTKIVWTAPPVSHRHRGWAFHLAGGYVKATSGSPLTLQAQLKDVTAKHPVANETVTLQQWQRHKGWTAVGTATTDATGTGSWTITPTASGRYRLVFAGDPAAGTSGLRRSTSAPLNVIVPKS